MWQFLQIWKSTNGLETLLQVNFGGEANTSEAFLQVPLDDKEGMQLCKQDLKSSSAGG